METIKVEETDEPGVCLQHPPITDPTHNPMVVCRFVKGHTGPHEWELPPHAPVHPK